MQKAVRVREAIPHVASGWFEEEVKLLAFINVGMYTVRQEKKEEFLALSKRISDHMKGSKLLSEAIKSRRLFTRCMGGTYGEFIDVWEFRNWTDYDKYLRSYAEDEVWGGFWKEFMLLVEPSTQSWINLDEVP